MADPVLAHRMMQLDDRQLERACAFEVIRIWQHNADCAGAALRAAPFGFVMLWGAGGTAALGMVRGIASGGLQTWFFCAMLVAAAPYFYFMWRWWQLRRQPPEIAPLMAIQAEMARRLGDAAPRAETR